MNRVQVLLKPETITKVKKAAKKNKTSASGFIREVVEKELEKEKSKKDPIKILLNAAKNASKGGPRDLSTNDDYLYGKDSVL
ncbi:hypothetical protein GF360_00555 [candidate division WWE3 bacterium]|nr:hypothetical protein [candidate division WWE3 bacterium]